MNDNTPGKYRPQEIAERCQRRRRNDETYVVRPQALRDDAGVGDGSVAARQRAPGRVRRRLVRDPEGCLQPHARQRPGQRPARRGVTGRGGRCATDKDVSIGGAGLAAAAIELGLVDELRMFRNPVVVGGGTPFLPPVTEDVPLDLIETRAFGSRVIYERYARACQRSR
jgi:RibD C-terminal domain